MSHDPAKNPPETEPSGKLPRAQTEALPKAQSRTLTGNKWSIRRKSVFGVALLVLMVLILFGMGLQTGYAYRCLVRALSSRVPELPIAAELSRDVAGLRMTLSRLQGLHANRFAFNASSKDPFAWSCRMEFQLDMQRIKATLDQYRDRLEDKIREGSEMNDNRAEWETVHEIERSLVRIEQVQSEGDWLSDLDKIDQLEKETEHLQQLGAKLPSHLHNTLGNLAGDVRLKYRALIITTWAVGIAATLILFFYIQLFYRWVFEPLRTLLGGSRRVAAGDFNYRIQLKNDDEMAELADAMNNMTERFQAIRDDLDAQVRQRTREVVRSEQLASVGFLAAGVAHEINNPLASIAMCAESLEARLRHLKAEGDDEQKVINGYLKMIQEEAFRCKEITEKLLDFSRAEDTRRQAVELTQLIRDVIDMVGHLSRYRDRTIRFEPEGTFVIPVNPQEIKQVVLNLLTNALDSLEPGGTVLIELSTKRSDGQHFVELDVIDDGCGMQADVLKHIFDPFYTRKRSTHGQEKGTGLGLSITYRIVQEHGGTIEATSEGAGLGSVFRVRLPIEIKQKSKGRLVA